MHVVAIPAPIGGVLLVGERYLTYHNGKSSKSIEVNHISIRAYDFIFFIFFSYFLNHRICQVDSGSRFLMGSHDGSLYAVTLVKNSSSVVVDIALEKLGEVFFNIILIWGHSLKTKNRLAFLLVFHIWIMDLYLLDLHMVILNLLKLVRLIKMEV